MISSVLSSNKDVVALIPVQKMTNQDIYHMTKEVVKNASICGYRIICILSDNNVVNRKMFMNLSGTNCLVPHINNPINPDHEIYLLFDTVHLLKCIRINWINDAEKTLTYPNFSDHDLIMHASFVILLPYIIWRKNRYLKKDFN